MRKRIVLVDSWAKEELVFPKTKLEQEAAAVTFLQIGDDSARLLTLSYVVAGRGDENTDGVHRRAERVFCIKDGSNDASC